MRQQTIFRTEPSSNQAYTLINNKLLQDERISDETRGLICKILSKPLDWEITIIGIIKSGKAGKDKVYRMVNEAKKFGYIIDAVKECPGRKKTYAISDDPDYLEDRYNRIAQEIEKEQEKMLPEKAETSGVTNSEKPETMGTNPENPTQNGSTFPEKTFPENPPLTNKRYITNIKTNTSYLQKDEPEEKFELKFEPPKRRVYDPKNFKQRHQLPEYWRVEPPLRAWARNGKVGATDAQIDDEFEKFRDHHQAHGKTMMDWNKAFQNWMRNARKFGNLDQDKSQSSSNVDWYNRLNRGVQS